MFKYELGQRVRDIVTGFEGVVVSRTEYLNKCIRYCVQPTDLDKDNDIKESYYFDEEQLESTVSEENGVKDKIKNIFSSTKQSGGERKDPPTR